MKIEICDNTYWVAIACCSILSAAALFCVLSYHYTERTKAAFAAGYQESVQVSGGYWIKKGQP